ncbi:MAG TPA: NUDIX domain-containing protein [Candidatus Krumholzibacteria bacterium]|jgi:predicted NUDIX family phosphoesterase
MQFILVVPRQQIFPRLSPQGFLPKEAVDLDLLREQVFFAEREFMEQCSHFKQLIPYITLTLGDEILCYQRQSKHSEQRLGGLWTVGFGGHVEPLDRNTPQARELGLLEAAALRELHEETGLDVQFEMLHHAGLINSEQTDVSTVHLGLYYTADLGALNMEREQILERVREQAEPFKVLWRSRDALRAREESVPPAPEGGEWEDWSRIALGALGAL